MTYTATSTRCCAVDAYALGNGTEVVVRAYGAPLVEVRTPGRDGLTDNVVHRLPTLAACEDRAANDYVGATLGRFCRNVTHGAFTLDGVRHVLDRNQGPNHLHRGTCGSTGWCGPPPRSGTRSTQPSHRPCTAPTATKVNPGPRTTPGRDHPGRGRHPARPDRRGG
ncbi:hypothetical protein ACFYXD_15220 [Streptomyces platensis]|uniref:aldose epimerase family protein n=1 Tax=Streptomyces platensis TaxID=58346 RepID=UPI0036A42DCA